MGESLSVNYTELLIELGIVSMNTSTGYSGCFLSFISLKCISWHYHPKDLSATMLGTQDGENWPTDYINREEKNIFHNALSCQPYDLK